MTDSERIDAIVDLLHKLNKELKAKDALISEQKESIATLKKATDRAVAFFDKNIKSLQTSNKRLSEKISTLEHRLNSKVDKSK